MSQSPRPRLVQINHEDGEFLVRFNSTGTEVEAIAFAVEQVAERWGLDVIEAHIATNEDVTNAEGQHTDLNDEV